MGNKPVSIETIYQPTVAQLILEDIALHQPHNCSRGEVLARLGYDSRSGGKNFLRFRELVEAGILDKTNSVPPSYKLAQAAVEELVQVCDYTIGRAYDVIEAVKPPPVK